MTKVHPVGEELLCPLSLGFPLPLPTPPWQLVCFTLWMWPVQPGHPLLVPGSTGRELLFSLACVCRTGNATVRLTPSGKGPEVSLVAVTDTGHTQLRGRALWQKGHRTAGPFQLGHTGIESGVQLTFLAMGCCCPLLGGSSHIYEPNPETSLTGCLADAKSHWADKMKHHRSRGQPTEVN